MNVHVNDNYLTANLSSKDAKRITQVRVTMGASIEKDINVIVRDGTVSKIKERGFGLYYYDMESADIQGSSKTNVTINP